MRRLVVGMLAALAILGVAAAAQAAPVTLTFVNPALPGNIYQQTLNHPCVIGDPSCQNPAGFPYTSESGPAAGHVYDLTSPTYTVGQLTALFGETAFKVGIDVNWAAGAGAEVLQLFEVVINGDVAFNYVGPTAFAAQNNGNGFSDALLTGIDLSGYGTTLPIYFHAVWSNDTDGMEEYFLIPDSAPPVPEPASILLLGSGLIGVAKFARRRR